MKKSVALLTAVLMLMLCVFSGCGAKEDKKTDEATPTTAATTEAATDEGADDQMEEQPAENALDEEAAKAVAFEQAGVKETMVEELTVESKSVDGASVYVIRFVWSGFDYEYTVDANSGEILEEIFDGTKII